MLKSKNILSLFVLVAVVILSVSLFSGCSAEISSDSPVLIKNFECDMCVVSRNRSYLCSLRRKDTSSTLTVKEPDELDGLKLEYQGGVYSVTFKGLKLSLDDSKTQLTQHFADGMMKVLDKTFSLEKISAKQESGIWIYNGDTTYGEFEVKFDGDGKLLSINIPKIETAITFENFKEIE